ncbi:MAG: HAD hydrolase-like protein [Saccharofermentanales bacterium]
MFDLDGTLYQTHETGLPPLYELCSKYNIILSPEDERFLLFTTTESLLRKVVPNMTTEEILKFCEELKWLEIEKVREHGRLFDGVECMLASLAAKSVVMAICGMGSKEYIEAVLIRCNIKKYFKYIYSRVEGLIKSQVLARLLTETRQDARQCFMVGDSITDLKAARVNMIPFIGVSYGYGANDIANADEMAHDVLQLNNIIHKYLIYSRIEREISRFKRPVIIGISGVDTSGKTIFSTSLQHYFECKGYQTQLINIDDFHNPRTIRSKDISPQGYLDYAFDLVKLTELLEEMREGNIDKQIKLLDLSTDTYTNKKRFFTDKNTIVILEGVLLYRPPLDQFFSYRIFLDIGFDEVIRRATRRDVPEYGELFLKKYRERYIPAQQIYLDKFTPKLRCNMVINNTDFNQPIIEAKNYGDKKWKS